ncbi:amidase family protein, partial [Rhizobium leguminosarum]
DCHRPAAPSTARATAKATSHRTSTTKLAPMGSKTTLPDYLAILEARRRLIADVERLVGDRLLAFPTVAHVAPPIGPLEQDDELFFATNNKTLRNTALGNFLDWCGVSIPCGTGEAGMPVGLLLSATAHRDEALLGIALAAEPVIRDDFA